jgi:PAS domain S-box-containing protein
VRRAAASEDGEYEAEYRMVAADGREVWLHDRGSAVKDADGRITHLRGLAVDITRNVKPSLR